MPIFLVPQGCFFYGGSGVGGRPHRWTADSGVGEKFYGYVSLLENPCRNSAGCLVSRLPIFWTSQGREVDCEGLVARINKCCIFFVLLTLASGLLLYCEFILQGSLLKFCLDCCCVKSKAHEGRQRFSTCSQKNINGIRDRNGKNQEESQDRLIHPAPWGKERRRRIPAALQVNHSQFTFRSDASVASTVTIPDSIIFTEWSTYQISLLPASSFSCAFARFHPH